MKANLFLLLKSCFFPFNVIIFISYYWQICSQNYILKGPLHTLSGLSQLILIRCSTCRTISHSYLKIFQNFPCIRFLKILLGSIYFSLSFGNEIDISIRRKMRFMRFLIKSFIEAEKQTAVKFQKHTSLYKNSNFPNIIILWFWIN